jgi:hypothetical protein
MLVLILVGGTAWASEVDRLHFGADVSVRWDENIGLAGNDEDEFDDVTTRVAGQLQYDIVAQAGREFVVKAELFYAQVADLSDLSNYGLMVGADYRGEFGPALTAPWYTIGVEYTTATFDDSDPRDGEWLDAEVVIGKRFSEKLNISSGFRYHRRWQRDDDPFCPQFPGNNNSCSTGTIRWNGDDVFNQERMGVFVNAELNFGARTSGFVELSFVEGDEDATGRMSNFNFCGAGGGPGGANSGCNTFTNDLAFGSKPGVPWFQVWKVDDVFQRSAEIGVTHAFNDQWNLNVTAIYMNAPRVNNHDVSQDDYSNTAVIATLGLTF